MNFPKSEGEPAKRQKRRSISRALILGSTSRALISLFQLSAQKHHSWRRVSGRRLLAVRPLVISGEPLQRSPTRGAEAWRTYRAPLRGSSLRVPSGLRKDCVLQVHLLGSAASALSCREISLARDSRAFDAKPRKKAQLTGSIFRAPLAESWVPRLGTVHPQQHNWIGFMWQPCVNRILRKWPLL
jgi:hypothetical protein